MVYKKGYKTWQSEEILNFLEKNANRHLTIDEITASFADGEMPIGKTTIYRQLEKLVALGQVKKFQVGRNIASCYQYDNCGNCMQHLHLKCAACGKLFHVEVDEAQFADIIKSKKGFKIDLSRTVIYGLCDKCQLKENI